jgi:hypothetical protein
MGEPGLKSKSLKITLLISLYGMNGRLGMKDFKRKTAAELHSPR